MAGGFCSRMNILAMGLSIIRERAASINAMLDITSQPGGGTELALVWHN